MIAVRRSADRGHFDHGWLDTRHTFSFAAYHDPRHMGFRALRVINEDRVAPGAGFPLHPHENMEIVTYVLDGALRHRDTLGNGTVIQRGEVQRMSAGTGVMHSEFNASSAEPVHFLQIWILPAALGVEPSYEQRPFDLELRRGALVPIAAPDGAEGALTIHQDARVFASRLAAGDEIAPSLAPGRGAWVQVASGEVEFPSAALSLSAGDGAAIEDERIVAIRAVEDAELLLFDLP